jgi:hypothetical protein
MIAVVILFIICAYILHNTREPYEFTDVKERYRILREHLKETDDPKFRVLHRHVPITGFTQMKNTVGYNTNKGGEITICLNGGVNEIFHVLIHELAHSTVKEYSHSPEFWENYVELRNIAQNLNIYEKIPQKTKFCGQHVQDK